MRTQRCETDRGVAAGVLDTLGSWAPIRTAAPLRGTGRGNTRNDPVPDARRARTHRCARCDPDPRAVIARAISEATRRGEIGL
jgi:hypothetical protein